MLHIIGACGRGILFESYFEVIRHKMPKEKAVRYVRMLEKYHDAGWNAVFSLVQDDSL